MAPLTPCRRNMLQGCCPLKVLESMACGTAVIASDLPVIRELVTHEKHGLLVPPPGPPSSPEPVLSCSVNRPRPKIWDSRANKG
ncbi:glycosyltransferase [Shewanella sp. JL219SE-S6]